jgi:hypothetical protein
MLSISNFVHLAIWPFGHLDIWSSPPNTHPSPTIPQRSRHMPGSLELVPLTSPALTPDSTGQTTSLSGPGPVFHAVPPLRARFPLTLLALRLPRSVG